MKKKLPYLLPSFVFFLGAPIVWILCFREVPLRISPETTYITEPKTADGLCVDYFAVIKDRFEPKCKPEDNGFRMVVAALGKSPYFDQPDWYWESLCRELELDPKLTPTLKFEPATEFFKREYLIWLDENETVTTSETVEKTPDEPTDTEIMSNSLRNWPWTGEKYPYMVRWIEENSPILDLVAEALRQKHCFVPMLRAPSENGQIWIQQGFHSNVTFPREIEDAFYFRLQYRLGKDDIDGAWLDAGSVSRLRIHQKFHLGMMPDHYSGPFERVIRNHELSEEQRKRFLADLDNLPARESSEESFRRWRLLDLWYVAVYPLAFPNIQHQYMNWSLIAAETNRFFDRLEQTLKQIEQEPDRREEIIDDLRTRLTTKPERSALGKWLGKPATVDERSVEFAWANNQMTVPNMLHILLNAHEKSLDELRQKIEENNEKEPETQHGIRGNIGNFRGVEKRTVKLGSSP